MNSPSGLLLPLLVCHTLVAVVLLLSAAATVDAGRKALPKPFNNSISAIFIFGDSTVDPGNNDYVGTIFKSNFPPYGKDFLNHIPTGRFTNGKLVTDFIAEYLGIKETIPPYLDPTLSIEELSTGVSFASAGSGYDPLTAKLSSVLTMEQQLYYFREYKAKIQEAIGKAKAKAVIKKAVFLISCGTNDYVVNYFTTPLRQYTYSVPEYQQFLLQILHQFIQGLLAEGAEAVVVVSLPPMGCLPSVITLNSDDAFHDRSCIEKFSSAAGKYNAELQNLLNSIPLRRPNIKLIYADIFSPLNDMIRNPSKYDYSDVNTGCCGSGLIEGAILCNPTSIICADDSKYIFWDSVHPTQAAYHDLFQALRPTVDAFLRDNTDN